LPAETQRPNNYALKQTLTSDIAFGDIEQNPPTLANLFFADFHKPIEQSILQLTADQEWAA
jgi:hypothetical protein